MFCKNILTAATWSESKLRKEQEAIQRQCICLNMCQLLLHYMMSECQNPGDNIYKQQHKVKIMAFWNVNHSSMADRYWHFWGMCCIQTILFVQLSVHVLLSFNTSSLLYILDSGCNTWVILHLDQHLLSGINVFHMESLRNIPAKMMFK